MLRCVRQEVSCSLVFFNVMKEMEMELGRVEVRFSEEERDWRFPGLLYADKLVLRGEKSTGEDP